MNRSLQILFSFLLFSVLVIAQTTPSGVAAIGYEKHIDVIWQYTSDANIGGYRIYRYNGSSYELIGSVGQYQSFYSDWIDGTGVQKKYKVTSYLANNSESAMSGEVIATTHAMTDEEFLDMTERATFRYFWDYAHPACGLARERFGSGETCTIGGSGFGVLAIIAGVERGYITRRQGAERMYKIVNFLKNKAIRYHGAFSHWVNGTTGETIPFSTYDDGGDLVETAFMIQGLLAARQYFNQSDTYEVLVRSFVTSIWQAVEWDWYSRSGNFIYWHWSPNYGWQMNFRVQGPNEAMIVYLLAIASTTHGVSASLFTSGWASSNYYVNGKSFYGYKLWVGWDYGGPLFFAHYSFLGFDPRNKKDKYCNYFENNKSHALIHRAYAVANPKKFKDYGANNWGFTASDDPTGYGVHEPSNDNGTISPTAALSSMPYTPTESIEYLKNIYRTYGSKVWKDYGFIDAYNPNQNWFATSYLAIDQGPIIDMIENYRSGLLWSKFMANPEIQPMLDAIGFAADPSDVSNDETIPATFALKQNYPNPFNPETKIQYHLASPGLVKLRVFDLLGNEIVRLVNTEQKAGTYSINFNSGAYRLSSGAYFYRLETESFTETKKMIILK